MRNSRVLPNPGIGLVPIQSVSAPDAVRVHNPLKTIDLRKKDLMDGRDLLVRLRGYDSIIRQVGLCARIEDRQPVSIVVEGVILCHLTGVHLNEQLGLVLEAASDLII